jgi:hypothetical protein
MHSPSAFCCIRDADVTKSSGKQMVSKPVLPEQFDVVPLETTVSLCNGTLNNGRNFSAISVHVPVENISAAWNPARLHY